MGPQDEGIVPLSRLLSSWAERTREGRSVAKLRTWAGVAKQHAASKPAGPPAPLSLDKLWAAHHGEQEPRPTWRERSPVPNCQDAGSEPVSWLSLSCRPKIGVIFQEAGSVPASRFWEALSESRPLGREAGSRPSSWLLNSHSSCSVSGRPAQGISPVSAFPSR